MPVSPLIACGRLSKAIRSAMSFHANDEEHLRELQEQIRRTRTITPRLMADAIARACPRLQIQHPAARARVTRLIESGAFADATSAFVEARRDSLTAAESRPQSVPLLRPTEGYAICCDNFA
jgi:hypothetical protein